MRRLERLADVFRSERRRRQVLADRDCRVASQVCQMALVTSGNRLAGGRVEGDGPYRGLSKATAIRCWRDLPAMHIGLRRMADALQRMEQTPNHRKDEP